MQLERQTGMYYGHLYIIIYFYISLKTTYYYAPHTHTHIIGKERETMLHSVCYPTTVMARI